MRLNKGDPIATFAAVGSNVGAFTSDVVEVDMELASGQAWKGLLVITATAQTGQGGTPTSPGSGKGIVVNYALSNNKLDRGTSAGLIAMLAPKATTLAADLPDSDDSDHVGGIELTADYVPIIGDKLYVWLTAEQFSSANSKITVKVYADLV